jgi:hypothetical protein
MQTRFVPAAAGLASMPTVVLAHPGHDHSHWSSGPSHALLLLGILAAASALGWALLRQRRRAAIRSQVKDRG